VDNYQGYSYGIGHSNRGYQILKKAGWSETHGLGKHGEGRKYPIKTTLKCDQKGLGLDNPVKRITHPSNEVNANLPKRMKLRRVIDKKQRHEKQQEMKIRQMLS